MDNNIKLCPLCGEQGAHPIQGERRSFRHCRECDLIFEPSAYHLSVEEEVHRYSQHNNFPDNPGYVKFLSEVLDIIRRFGPDQNGGVGILDYGCGPGPVFVGLCRQAGYDAHGYDPHFFPGMPEGRRYEVISAIEVWEHFRHPATEIGKLLTHLAPDGLLAVRTLFHTGADDFPTWWYNKDDTHLAFYSQHTFKWIAEKFNLNPVFTDGEKLILFKPKH